MLWVAALAGLTYLPSALRLGYFRDDWYYAYDSMVGPSGVFRFMFAEDRPARGPFFEIYQALFGIAPTPYHLAMLFWRIVGGAAVVWLFHLLWPRRSAAGLAAGAIFAIYPGFTWWVQGIEYQPMVASAALMVLSLALTVLALRAGTKRARFAAAAGAILTGWLYLALVEYAAGMEVLRLGLILVAIGKPHLPGLRARLASTLRAWLVYIIIPAGFILWRFLLFTSERKATDLSVQLGALVSDPLSTAARWSISTLLSLVNVTLTPLVQPLLSGFFSVGLRSQLLGLALAVVAGVLAWQLLERIASAEARPRKSLDDSWNVQALRLGVVGLLFGILPVIIANRQITLPSFSHYALPASLGLVFLLAGLIACLADRQLQGVIAAALIGLAVLAQQGAGAAALNEERTIAAFWHQVAWRAPSINTGTTLLVYYPGVDYGSDSDVVWGPANFVYYPDRQGQLPVHLNIAAVTPDRDSLNAMLVGREALESTYRSHTMNIDYGNVLIAVQSASDSCVRVLDYRQAMWSTADDATVRLLGSSSSEDAIGVSGSAPVLPAHLFGPEPEHKWCYYFEQASLAAQQADWQRVAALQAEAGRLGLHPNDQVEWAPFLQAQIHLGDLQSIKEIASRINTEKLYRLQACVNIQRRAAYESPLPPASQAYATELFCRGGS
jgi:hypothetical protein